MRGRAYVYEAPASVYQIDLTDSMPLERLQSLVGGWIESVPYWNLYRPTDSSPDASCVAYCNEEGKLKEDMFVNNRATLDWDKAIRRISHEGVLMFPRGLIGLDGRASDYLVGTIVVLVGDKEWMKDHVCGNEGDEDDWPDDEWWPYGDFVPMQEEGK